MSTLCAAAGPRPERHVALDQLRAQAPLFATRASATPRRAGTCPGRDGATDSTADHSTHTRPSVIR
ncbi:hypothetical protein [Streptomyces sp. NBC_01465]|uniref:hypothetical protein n=1 Tax=Streptomyces sp. NBC_01465 TaxID=2903878 RepID=UPI002E2F6AF8|nr:hypothetical protein [Streptomyces sp. NBC_01465]